MERIRHAVEQAREQRRLNKGAIGQKPVVGPSAVSTAPFGYTQTKTLNIAAEVFERNRLHTGHETDASTTAYKILRTHVARIMAENGWNALAVTSPRVGNGKSITAINLALSLAREIDKTVLLVDLDLRQPSLHRYFELEPEFGITDYLLRDVPLPRILFNPGIERLVILPGKKAASSSTELLSSPKMKNLVAELKTRYPQRFVIFDIPQLLDGDEALAFSPFVDAVLLVLEEGKTTSEEVSRSMDLLKVTNVLGTVLNKSR